MHYYLVLRFHSCFAKCPNNVLEIKRYSLESLFPFHFFSLLCSEMLLASFLDFYDFDTIKDYS